jgi:hypothetical protein
VGAVRFTGVEVHPRDVLAAAGDGSADPEPEEREHLGERPARGRQDHAGARDHDPDARRRGGERLVLPGDHDAGEEVVPGRRVLVELLVAPRAVEADRGLGDERSRTLLGRNTDNRLDQRSRRPNARLADGLLGLVGPALRDRLAEQVHDGVGAGERGLGRRLVHRPRPGVRLDLISERPASAAGVARERNDLFASRQQRAHESATDRARGSADDDAHQRLALR